MSPSPESPSSKSPSRIDAPTDFHKLPVSRGFYLALTDLGSEMDESDLLRRRALYHIRNVASAMIEGAQHVAHRYDIHPTDLNVLLILFHANVRHEGKVSVIQRALGFTPGGMTRRIDSMVRKDFVRRIADPADGRSWIAQLTATGAALASRIHDDPRTRGIFSSERLSCDEWRTLGDLLEKIARAEGSAP